MSDQTEHTLGEIVIDSRAFDLDLKINSGYQDYSQELLRLSLLALAGVSAVWLKLFVPDERSGVQASPVTAVLLLCTFVSLASSAGTALGQRYTAAHSLGHHLKGLRLRARNRESTVGRDSDFAIAKKVFKHRRALFQWSDRLLRASMIFLLLGVILFAVALCPVMFKQLP